MHEDRRNEAFQEDEQSQVSSLLTAGGQDYAQVGCSSSALYLDPGSKLGPGPEPGPEEELPCSSSDTTSSASLSLSVIPASELGRTWTSLMGEFSLRNLGSMPGLEHQAFMLHRVCDQLCLCLSCREGEGAGPETRPHDAVCAVECTLHGVSLEDLNWLQKRRAVQLCHQPGDDSIKVSSTYRTICEFRISLWVKPVLGTPVAHWISGGLSSSGPAFESDLGPLRHVFPSISLLLFLSHFTYKWSNKATNILGLGDMGKKLSR